MPLFPRQPPNRRAPMRTEIAGAGDVSVSTDGRGGAVVRDGRPDSEWGRIASHVSANEYTAIRLDDGDTAYPDRDALTVQCWELNGRDDVAVDTLVRLEANRAGDGFTFVAAPATGDAHFLAPVYCAATTAGTLATDFEAGDTLDGVTLTAGMSVLIAGQTTASENGIYEVAASGAPTRRSDADTSAEVHGAAVVVQFGDTLARTVWVCTAPNAPSSFTDQIWEQVGNTVYEVDAGESLDGWAAPGSGYNTPIPCRLGPRSPAGQLGAWLDDGPGFASNANFGGGAPPQFRSLQFGLDSTAGTDAAGYPKDMPIAFTTVTRNDTGLATGTVIAVGLAAGLEIGTAVVDGPSVDNPLVLRAVGDGTVFTTVELSGNTNPGGSNIRPYIRLSGAAVTVARYGGTATLDATGGYIVNGTAGLSGALAPGATATGGIITDLGTGAFVGTASSNAFTNTNSFTSPGAGDVPLTVRAAAAQTADLIQVLDSGGLTVLARVEADGEIEAASGAVRLNSVLNDGQLALYNSAGASYATLTAGASNVLTASGGLTTGGALTVSSGGATITAGGLTVSAGGANITGTVTATTFSGSGASLTALNASNVSSGTVAAARLPIGTDVQAYDADLSALAALSGTNTIYYRSGAATWSAVTIGSGLSFSSGTLSNSAAGVVPRGHIDGLILSYNSSTTVNIAAGQCAEDTAAYMLTLSASTKVIQSSGSWTAGTGNNGLDTGAFAGNTWYHVFVIAKADGTSPDILFSTSATAPTMPSTYTLKRRIGAIKTGAAGISNNWVQRGEYFLWSTPQDDISALNPGTSAVSRTLSTPTGVRTLALVSVGYDATATGDNPSAIYLSDLDQSDGSPSVTINTYVCYSTTAHIANTIGRAEIWTNTSSQIRSRLQLSATNTRLRIQTHGWRDPRGRDNL